MAWGARNLISTQVVTSPLLSEVGLTHVQDVADPRVGRVPQRLVPRRRREGRRHRATEVRVPERMHEGAKLAVDVAVREEGRIIEIVVRLREVVEHGAGLVRRRAVRAAGLDHGDDAYVQRLDRI